MVDFCCWCAIPFFGEFGRNGDSFALGGIGILGGCLTSAGNAGGGPLGGGGMSNDGLDLCGGGKTTELDTGRSGISGVGEFRYVGLGVILDKGMVMADLKRSSNGSRLVVGVDA